MLSSKTLFFVNGSRVCEKGSKQMKIDNKCKHFEIQFMNRLCEKSDCIPCNSHTSADDDTNASATNKFMVIG